MRNRNVPIRLWLDKAEAEKLAKKAASCKMTKSSYLRFIINDYVPKEAPDLLLCQLRAIGNNMCQIAHRAHALGMIDVPMHHKNADRITAVCDDLMSAVLPTKKDR